MRSYLLLGAAALANAGPAANIIDFDAIIAAPLPAFTGPPAQATVTQQTGVYNEASASASAVAAASTVAIAIATASEPATTSIAARALQERSFCIFGWCFGVASTTSSSKTTATATSTSKTVKATSTASGTTTASLAAITSAASIVVPTTCTPVSWTNTFAFTTDPACTIGPFEEGTYCGFINPEDPCAPQPAGSGPVAVPDTPEGFKGSSVIRGLAQNAKTPKGYAQNFKDLEASVNANSYLGFKTLNTYDVQGCADFCDATDLCTSFNVFIERNPAWNPDQCSCDMPTSTTHFKCSIWGSGVTSDAATNQGQVRIGGFKVGIVGSNGYQKTNETAVPDTPPKFNNPQKCGAVHDHPRTCLKKQHFPGPYNPSVCADLAIAQNAKNQVTGLLAIIKTILGFNSAKCNFFQANMIEMDGVPQGTYCLLYAQQYKPTEATYIPAKVSNHNWKVSNSWSYCLA